MAHIEKATRRQVASLLAHDERLCENHTNEKIRPEASHLNYNLLQENPLSRYNKILEESFVLNRPDVNTLTMIAVTLPKNVAQGDEKKFFEATHNYLTKYFGEDSTVSSIVHLDETTPHIHYKAVPRYWNDKKERWQVSFEKVCPRNYYKNFHKELSSAVEKALGYTVAIENGATVAGNKSITELKTKTAAEKLKALEKQIAEKKAYLDDININQAEIEKIKPTRAAFGSLKDITIEDVEKLKESALKAVEIKNRETEVKQAEFELKQKELNVENCLNSAQQKLETASHLCSSLANLDRVGLAGSLLAVTVILVTIKIQHRETFEAFKENKSLQQDKNISEALKLADQYNYLTQIENELTKIQGIDFAEELKILQQQVNQQLEKRKDEPTHELDIER